MPNNKLTPEEENKPFKVITYIDEVSFNYTLPDEEEPRTLEHEVTLIWEDTLEKFFEEHGKDKKYTITRFTRKRDETYFIDKTESIMDDLIEEVQEEISNKMKFGFEFTGPLHNDD